jgi:FlaA1/EpsC-like NDP-sugar epimerase
VSLRKSQIYIIGAGLAGISIAKEIKLKGIFGRVVAFLDDDPQKIGRTISGIPILGPVETVLEQYRKQPRTTHYDEALIAIPSGTREQIQKIYDLLRRAGFEHIRILPGLSQILSGDAHLIQAREINPEDLLTRTPVKVQLKESLAYVRGKRVLVTGAGGSIGSELARQLLSGGAERLYLFGHGENSIYGIDRELRLLQEEGVGERATIVPVIGELQDRDYMFHILKALRADVVFHAAAYKHVPLMEANAVAAVQNNVFGTKNLLDASIRADVSRFVMISTDKAVDPNSIYGASKLLAEELVIRERHNGHRYIVVRFGNVLGSRGSILPLFRKQILKGGPVTITHPQTSRFFMTIPEASSLVLKAGGIDVDGELLLLDMGEPLNIQELAEQMIRFYDFTPGKDIRIVYTGLRPGEKLTERLWSDNETRERTDYPKIFRLKRNGHLSKKLDDVLEHLKPICYFDEGATELFRNRRELKRVIREIAPSLQVPKNEPKY